MNGYTKQYIDGKWEIGTGSRTLSNFNPFNGELLYSYQSASEKDLDRAYRAAAKAQEGWEKTTPSEKRDYLENLVQVLKDEKDKIYDWLRAEGGSTISKCDLEYYCSVEAVKDALSYPFRMEGKILPSSIAGKENYVYRKPKGVIGVISPWNFPFYLTMRSIVPAIATGNAVVIKPASDTPASAFLIAELFEKAGFPNGLINVIAGSGSDIGDAFVTHSIPKLISFTGSTSVGRHIGEIASRNLKDISLELGGNNMMIVLKDADIKRAAKAAVIGAYSNQGQICMALNRIIVDNDIYDEFVKEFVSIVKILKVGDPADPQTFLGPIINKDQVKNIESEIKATINAGAKVALEGKTEGLLIHPWVLTEVSNDMGAAHNEVFGPVCCVIRAKDEESAIRIANDSEYGLSGSVFSGDVYHGIQVAQQIETGMIHINDQSVQAEAHVMFGGEKASGLGRFNGEWVIEKFTTDKWISVQDPERIYF